MIVALLAIALIVISSNQPNSTGAPVAITQGSVPVVSAFPSPGSATSGTTTTATTPSAPTESVSATAVATVAEVVDGALVAWGEFAVSGDLGGMRQWFWQDGPQWLNLESEAPSIEARADPGPAYAVSIEGASIEAVSIEDLLRDSEALDSAGSAASTSGTVRFERPGEQAQQFSWTIVLIQRAGDWRVWAVEPTN